MVEASLLSAARLRVLVLVLKPQGIAPNQRFRLEQWAPRLARDEGIELDLVPFESPSLTKVIYRKGHRAQKAGLVLYDFARRLPTVLTARKYDAAIVVREAALIGPAIYERLLVRMGVPTLFDFDDAIWLGAAQSTVATGNGIFSKLHFYGKTKTICRIADGVLAGNEYLASYAREQSSNVFVIPTTIELDRYPVLPESDDPRFVVTWSGSLHTLVHFEHARAALEKLAKKRPLVVRVICNSPPKMPIAGAENVFIPWSEVGEAEAIAATHVGIMPLPDDEFARGKCGLKALQFMATGRPIVTSPVGMNATLVKPGINGLLASTTDEWVAALEDLASSPERRRELGASARRTIEDQFSAAVVSKLAAQALRATIALSPRA